LTYFFKAPKGKYLLGLASPGGAGRNKTLGQNEFSLLKISLPPTKEQQKIAQILSTWDKAIEKLEALITTKQKRKKALMQQLLTGKQRFPGFDGKWRFASFDDLFIVVNDKKTQVKSSDYLESGSTPVIDQGQKAIAGFTNNEAVYRDVPVIIFGDHTRIIKWVDFAFAPGADGTQVLKTKKPMDLKLGFFLLSHVDLPSLGYSRHMKELKEKEFKFPVNKREQQKIAAVLSAADNEITTHQTQLAALKQQKTGLMQQLLTGKKRVKVDQVAA
jgi:type I restriction enzyme S subunit